MLLEWAYGLLSKKWECMDGVGDTPPTVMTTRTPTTPIKQYIYPMFRLKMLIFI